MREGGNMKTILKIVVIFSFLATTSLVSAEIYKWVDGKGTIHFTDDPATIPENYWDKTESRRTEEDLMSLEERIRARQDQEKRVKGGIEARKQEYGMSLQKEKKPKAEKQIIPAKKSPETEIKKEENLRKGEDSYEKGWDYYGKGLKGVKLATPNGGSANIGKKGSNYGGKGKLKQ